MVKQNPEKFSSLAYALSKSMVRYPTIKEARIARAAGPRGISTTEWPRTIAPITAGTLVMNEMTKAWSCFRFLMTRTASVVPDREMPGKMEKP